MKIVLLFSCLLAVISASFAVSSPVHPNCNAAAEFVFNQAKQEDPSITSYNIQECNVTLQEFYTLKMKYRVEDAESGIPLTRFCYGITVWVRPFRQDVPPMEITRKGECTQS